MSLKQQLLEKRLLSPEGTFVIDNSSLETYLECPTAWHFRCQRRKIPSTTNWDLEYGTRIHTCLEYRYKFDPLLRDPLTPARLDLLIDDLWAIESEPINDWRSATYAKQCMASYNRQYQQEEFKVFDNLVEQPFELPLGKIDDVWIIWTGKIDMIVEQDNRLFILDHKTTQRGGDLLTMRYYMASGLRGYCYAATNLLKQPVNSCLLNVLICRKPTKTGTAFENVRSNIYFDQAILTEWQNNTMLVIERLLQDITRDAYPKHFTSCFAFRKCDYYDICCAPLASREAVINSGDFKLNTWSPLSKRGPVLEDYTKKNPPQKQAPTVTDITDLINLISSNS